MSLVNLIVSRIRERGALTAAAFIELALYHPKYGYYSAVERRSGRRGDFITSVDTGPLFGEILSVQLEEMWRELGRPATFDVVEAGAGTGRLMRDVLDATRELSPAFYDAVRVTLVERSQTACAAHLSTLGPHTERFVRSQQELPSAVEGAIVANELLDAMPVHLAVMTSVGLRELYVTADHGRLHEVEGELSTPLIAEHVRRTGIKLEDGSRIEVGLEAAAWIGSAARSLRRGFLLLFDYANDARYLSASGGTLRAYQGHTCTDEWLRDPGERDITARVNLTSIQNAAEASGLTTLGVTDLTYFLMGLDVVERLSGAGDAMSVARRRAAKSLVLPEGLGGTQKVLVFGKGVGHPVLRGLSRSRLT